MYPVLQCQHCTDYLRDYTLTLFVLDGLVVNPTRGFICLLTGSNNELHGTCWLKIDLITKKKHIQIMTYGV